MKNDTLYNLAQGIIMKKLRENTMNYRIFILMHIIQRIMF